VLRVRGWRGNRDEWEGGAEREGQQASSVDRVQAKMGSASGARDGSVRCLVITKASCSLFAVIHMKRWPIDGVEAIAVKIEW